MVKNFLQSKKLSWILFIIYLVILTWVILAKMDWDRLGSVNLSWISNPRLLLHPGVTWSSLNTDPYAYFNVVEVVLNIIFFIPFGIFLKLVNKRFGIFSITFFSFLLSLFYESSQYVFSIGFFDVTDLIDNTLGGLVGGIVISIFHLIFRERFMIYANALFLFFFSYIVYEIYWVL